MLKKNKEVSFFLTLPCLGLRAADFLDSLNEPMPIDDNTTPSTNTPINDATPSIDGNSLNANIVANYNSLEIDGKTYNIKYVDTKSDSRISVPYSIKASSNTSTSKVCILQDKGTKVKLGFDENDKLEIYQWVNDELEYVGVLTTNAADLSEDKTTGTFSGSLSLNLDIDIDDVTLMARVIPKNGWPYGYRTLDEAINKGSYLLSYNFKYNPEGNSDIEMRAFNVAFLEILTELNSIVLVFENGDDKQEYKDITVTDGKLYVLVITGVYLTSTALGLDRQLIKDPKMYRINRMDYVDLGTGVLWAKSNVGAKTPTQNGYHFMWGHVENCADCQQQTYTRLGVCFWPHSYLTKYCIYEEHGYNKESQTYGFMDGLIQLEAEDDAATVNMGTGWRTPTDSEWQDLLDFCYWQFITDYNNTGKWGYIVYAAKNEGDKGVIKGTNTTPLEGYSLQSAHIFLPMVYYRDHQTTETYQTRYWASTLNTNYGDRYANVFACSSSGSDPRVDNIERQYGCPVRAVKDKE